MYDKTCSKRKARTENCSPFNFILKNTLPVQKTFSKMSPFGNAESFWHTLLCSCSSVLQRNEWYYLESLSNEVICKQFPEYWMRIK